MRTAPRILCIGGHDPTGGAGIQADIETVAALGGRAITLLTALTIQDSREVASLQTVDPGFFARQLDTLIRDIRPDAVKIGMIGATRLIPGIQALLKDFEGPTVLDPVLAAGGGTELGDETLPETIAARLIPLITLATPNRDEARRLSGNADPEQAAAALVQAGARAVLLTGADEARGTEVTNRLYTGKGPDRAFRWPRLPQHYHGSGCTLASACATRLALGDDVIAAVDAAQAFTWRTLERAQRPGGGQWLPWRQP